MDPALAQLGWTEDQWNRICTTVTEEAQKARVAAQALPTVGTDDPYALAVSNYTLTTPALVPPRNPQVTARLSVDSDPQLYLTRIGVNVELRSHEAADPSLNAALVKFRRAANVIARVEDGLVFYGRKNTALGPPPVSTLNTTLAGVPAIFDHTNDTHNVPGIYPWGMGPAFVNEGPPIRRGALVPYTVPVAFASAALTAGGAPGDGVVNAIIAAINSIERLGYYGPFACFLGDRLFAAICTPAPTLVLPRDRILPFLQGPLLRSSVIRQTEGVVISLAGSAVELVVASGIKVRFTQQTVEGRLAFRVTERVAVRIKDTNAIQWIR